MVKTTLATLASTLVIAICSTPAEAAPLDECRDTWRVHASTFGGAKVWAVEHHRMCGDARMVLTTYYVPWTPGRPGR